MRGPHPAIEPGHPTDAQLTLDEISSLLAPVLNGRVVRSAMRASDGLTNRVYRIEVGPPRDALALRVYTGGMASLEKDRDVLARVSASVPVPAVLLAGDGRESRQPYIVYRWIDGITLNECRRQCPAGALLSLAEPLGGLAAGVASCPVAPELATTAVCDKLSNADDELRAGVARRRLGDAMADALRECLDVAAPRLLDADGVRGLVHGDFGGRNIIVAPAEDGVGRVEALLDWEHAFVGSALWDVGSLFRYARRYPPAFRDRFERGYAAAGGSLPADWYIASRLLDATRLVGILGDARDMAGVFDECATLLDALLKEAKS